MPQLRGNEPILGLNNQLLFFQLDCKTVTHYFRHPYDR
jgi:hypothetical protein